VRWKDHYDRGRNEGEGSVRDYKDMDSQAGLLFREVLGSSAGARSQQDLRDPPLRTLTNRLADTALAD